MSDTAFELSMDDYVANVLPWRTWVQYRNNGTWVTNQADIKEALDYRLGVRVSNVGNETFAKDVQIRIFNAYPARVTFFTDDSYGQTVGQLNKTFPNQLAPGDVTPWHWIHFRLSAGPDEPAATVASIGIYANIVPVGKSWTPFKAPLD
jgi:hypothetical protein